MAHVLVVPARELRHPVTLVVLVEPVNGANHRRDTSPSAPGAGGTEAAAGARPGQVGGDGPVVTRVLVLLVFDRCRCTAGDGGHGGQEPVDVVVGGRQACTGPHRTGNAAPITLQDGAVVLS